MIRPMIKAVFNDLMSQAENLPENMSRISAVHIRCSNSRNPATGSHVPTVRGSLEVRACITACAYADDPSPGNSSRPAITLPTINQTRTYEPKSL